MGDVIKIIRMDHNIQRFPTAWRFRWPIRFSEPSKQPRKYNNHGGYEYIPAHSPNKAYVVHFSWSEHEPHLRTLDDGEKGVLCYDREDKGA